MRNPAARCDRFDVDDRDESDRGASRLADDLIDARASPIALHRRRVNKR